MKAQRAVLVVFVLVATCGLGGMPLFAQPSATFKHTVPGDTAVVVRRIAVDSGAVFYPLGPPTRDGRYFSGADAKTGNLAVRDLRTGARRLLTATKGWSEGYVEQARISPDGKTVAFRWTIIEPYSYELRTIGMDGSGERTLVKSSGDQSEYADPADWSPDGRRLLAIMYRKDKSHQIALISATDGSVRVLKSLDWRAPHGIRFSPDGRWLAYDFQPDQDKPARNLFVLQVDGSRETRITSDSAPKVFVGWSADGLGLYYSTKKGDATTLWYVPVREGRPAGTPRLVRSDIWGAAGMSVSGAAVYYSVSDAKRTVYSVAVDLDAGRALAPPAVIVAGSDVASTSAAIWSPDGTNVAFVRGDQPTGESGHTLVIRNVATGEERPIQLELDAVGLGNWLPDGRAISIHGTRHGVYAHYRVDLATGKDAPMDPDVAPMLSPDGKTEFLVRNNSSHDSAFVIARTLATHQERELFRVGQSLFALTLSPDGTSLAFGMSDAKSQSTKLVVLPATGGEPTVFLPTDLPHLPHHIGGSLSWSPDSRHVLFAVQTPGGEDDALWVATPRTGETRKLLSAKDLVRPRLSPDGRRVIWVARTGGQSSELWVMENLSGSVGKRSSGSR